MCPSMPNLYADPNTLTCEVTCTSNFYAYDVSRKCVSMCPATPPYYANLQTKRCLTTCPIDTYKFTDNTFRGCVDVCPKRVYSTFYQVDLFAQNTTW